MEKIYVTKEGYNQYFEEIERLKTSLTKNATNASEAYTNAVGDGWHDNFEYEQTMREEKQIIYNIKKMMNNVKNLEIVKKHSKKDYIDIDDIVKITFIYKEDDEESEIYKLTGNYLSNDNEITLNSPLGKSIYNKKVGSIITYKVNGNSIKARIDDIIKKDD